MDKILKILHVEDSPTDAELIDRLLKKSGLQYESVVVSDKVNFCNVLENFEPDIVLSDHSLPSFSSVEVLSILKEFGKNIPFILITSTVSEQFAVSILKDGAFDYILKDRMERLPAAIVNAIEKYRSDFEREAYLQSIMESEAMFSKVEEIAGFGTWRIAVGDNSLEWSAGTYRMLGFTRSELKPSLEAFLERVHPDDATTIENILRREHTERTGTFQFRYMDPAGPIRHISTQYEVELDDSGVPTYITGFNRDVTKSVLSKQERNKITADIIQKNKDLERFAYIVSHNLRAPVANIISLAGLLEDSSEISPGDREIASALLSSIGKLDNIIVDLNHILQLNSRLPEKKGEVFFKTLVQMVMAGIHQPGSESVSLKLNFDAVEKMVTVRSHLFSIFYNLIVNSIKFRDYDHDCIIEIETHKTDTGFVICFTDNGKGIEHKNLKHLFDLYSRFDPAVEGKGMGLFMVKMYVESLKGRISVTSEPGVGTTFQIEFDFPGQTN